MTDLDLWGRIRTGDWLDAQTFPPLRYAVPGIIPEGFGILAAPPKAGKSWFALGILLDVAAGTPALGAVDAGPARPVLYLALEDGDRRLQGRARKLLGADAVIPARFSYLIDAHPDEVAPMIREWLDVHGESGPLVVLDTLGKVLPPARPGDGAYSRDYQIGSALKRLVDDHPGATLLAVHHTRKAGSEDFMDAVSGTNGLNGAADFTLVLARARNQDRATLSVTGRDVIEAEYALTVTDGRWTLDGGDLQASAAAAQTVRATAGVDSDMAAVVTLVLEADEPVSAAKVASALEFADGKARTYLNRAVEAGRIERASRGKFWRKAGSVPPVMSVSSVSDEQGPPLFDRHNDTLDTPSHVGDVCPGCGDTECAGDCRGGLS